MIYQILYRQFATGRFFGIKYLKIHIRKFHNQSRLECFYETCHLGPFRNFLSLTAHLNRVHSIDSYVNLKNGYRIHIETYPSEIDSGGDRQEGVGYRQVGDQQEGDRQEGDQQIGDRQERDQQESKKEISKKEIVKKVTSKKEIVMKVIVKKEEMMENLGEITVDWTRILSCTAI